MSDLTERARDDWSPSPLRARRRELEPLPSVLDLPFAPSRGARVVAATGTVVVHVLIGVLAGIAGSKSAAGLMRSLPITEMVDVDLPPPKALDPPAPEPTPEPTPRAAPRRAAEPPRQAPAPAAAQAGKVLTAPDDVVDFGDKFVVGKSATYAGGVTESEGTATHAVRASGARAGGDPGGGTGTLPSGDLSQSPRLAGGLQWDCPFPPEADDAGMDHAVVGLRVEVSAEGRLASVQVMRDPGYGFGREARRCANTKRWSPALDRAGRPTSATVVIEVRFDR